MHPECIRVKDSCIIYVHAWVKPPECRWYKGQSQVGPKNLFRPSGLGPLGPVLSFSLDPSYGRIESTSRKSVCLSVIT